MRAARAPAERTPTSIPSCTPRPRRRWQMRESGRRCPCCWSNTLTPWATATGRSKSIGTSSTRASTLSAPSFGIGWTRESGSRFQRSTELTPPARPSGLWRLVGRQGRGFQRQQLLPERPGGRGSQPPRRPVGHQVCVPLPACFRRGPQCGEDQGEKLVRLHQRQGSGCKGRWELKADGKTIASGPLPELDIAPRQERVRPLPADTPEPGVEYWLNFRLHS